MTLEEVIIPGRKYRQKKDNKWFRFSFWNLLRDTECDDGTDAQTKMNQIEGNLALMIQNVKQIKVVSSLPSDAASHTDTMYIVK